MPKNLISPIKIMNAVSLATNQTSKVMVIQTLDNISIQFNVVSGTPSGTLTVQVSNDYSVDAMGNVNNAGNWTTLTTPVAVTVTSGSPAQTFFDVNQEGAYAIRLVWTNSAGTGVGDAFFMAKGI